MAHKLMQSDQRFSSPDKAGGPDEEISNRICVRQPGIFVIGCVFDEWLSFHAADPGQYSISNAANARNHSIANSADTGERR